VLPPQCRTCHAPLRILSRSVEQCLMIQTTELVGVLLYKLLLNLVHGIICSSGAGRSDQRHKALTPTPMHRQHSPESRFSSADGGEARVRSSRYTRAAHTNISEAHFTWRGEKSDGGKKWSEFRVVEVYRGNE
jgi:hypothetical protein